MWWRRQENNSTILGPRDVYKGADFAFDECLAVLEREAELDRKKAAAAPKRPAKLDADALYKAIRRALGRFRHGQPSEAREILEKIVGD